MKNRHHALTKLITLFLAGITVLSITAVAAGSSGSSDDPLVTLSYLNDVFLPELLGKVDEKLSDRSEQLAEELGEQVDKDIERLEKKYGAQTSGEGESAGTVDSFTVVTMTSGQTLYGEIGCEVLLRVGSATVVSPSSPGLIDLTAASTLDHGKSLVKNHLYMMTISERGVAATAAVTKVLVRGTYEIK